MQMKFGEIEHSHETIALRSNVCVVRGKAKVKVANVTFCKKNNLLQF